MSHTVNFPGEQRADTLNRHEVVKDCRHTQGPSRADPTCTICLEDIGLDEKTVTHIGSSGCCGNAFHLSCFNELIAAAELADKVDPAGANSTEPNHQVAKCPNCRGCLCPWPKQGCELPEKLAIEREGVRFEAVRQAVVESSSPVDQWRPAFLGQWPPVARPRVSSIRHIPAGFHAGLTRQVSRLDVEFRRQIIENGFVDDSTSHAIANMMLDDADFTPSGWYSS